MEGNEAIGRGAVARGAAIFLPATPSRRPPPFTTPCSKLLPPNGGICLQGEDEIASIGFCLGAAMAGKKVMTATSGPGISLYSEQISFAIGSEIPIVIVDVQRLGPSTGSATKGADGDIQFLRWGNSGGLPVIVLAPVDVTGLLRSHHGGLQPGGAYRCPVFIAANKEISMTRETFDPGSRRSPRSRTPQAAAGRPFPCLSPQMAGWCPIFCPSAASHRPPDLFDPRRRRIYHHRPRQIARMQERLTPKSRRPSTDFTFLTNTAPAGADTLVITYGVTARAARAPWPGSSDRATGRRCWF
jgi:2-oxoglutarate ferredoxin oxidoreductase subunit alpha